MPLPRRTLGPAGHQLEVSGLGLGCMGFTAFYSSNPVSKEDALGTIRRAVELGCTFFDTAQIYNVGKTVDNNELILGEAIKGLPREQLTIATKWGIYADGLDGSRERCRESVQASLKFLGLDYIDLYYLHRKDPNTPIEETIGAMKELVEEGKIRHIGVSEVSAEDLRRAHAVHPITAYQLEWSLWTRDAEEEIVPLCRELGIGIVAYSPLGRGFLTGQIKSPADLADDDWRKKNPRLAEGAFEQNMKLVESVKGLAERKGCTAGQLALAWVMAQGEDVVPIPGTRRIKYLEENLGAADVRLSAGDLKELEGVLSGAQVVGERYGEDAMRSTFHYGKAKHAAA